MCRSLERERQNSFPGFRNPDLNVGKHTKGLDDEEKQQILTLFRSNAKGNIGFEMVHELAEKSIVRYFYIYTTSTS